MPTPAYAGFFRLARGTDDPDHRSTRVSGDDPLEEATFSPVPQPTAPSRAPLGEWLIPLPAVASCNAQPQANSSAAALIDSARTPEVARVALNDANPSCVQAEYVGPAGGPFVGVGRVAVAIVPENHPWRSTRRWVLAWLNNPSPRFDSCEMAKLATMSRPPVEFTDDVAGCAVPAGKVVTNPASPSTDVMLKAMAAPWPIASSRPPPA